AEVETEESPAPTLIREVLDECQRLTVHLQRLGSRTRGEGERISLIGGAQFTVKLTVLWISRSECLQDRDGLDVIRACLGLVAAVGPDGEALDLGQEGIGAGEIALEEDLAVALTRERFDIDDGLLDELFSGRGPTRLVVGGANVVGQGRGEPVGVLASPLGQ